MLQPFKNPKENDKYTWTYHVVEKMRYYRISENLIKRIIRHPNRKEEGIALGTVAVMQKARTKRPQEYWVMYQDLKSGKKRIISAWRYPGSSPIGERIPIPQDILDELEDVLT